MRAVCCLLSLCSLVLSSPMALRFMPSRRVGFALIAGCLLFSALAAANTRPGDLSVGEIEEQLQVIIHHELESIRACRSILTPVAAVDTLQQNCPLVEALNEHKRASAPETASLTSQIFAVLFPGSPAVNSLLATLYISGPPSMCSHRRLYIMSSRGLSSPLPFHLYRLPPGTMPSQHRPLFAVHHGRLCRWRLAR